MTNPARRKSIPSHFILLEKRLRPHLIKYQKQKSKYSLERICRLLAPLLERLSQRALHSFPGEGSLEKGDLVQEGMRIALFRLVPRWNPKNGPFLGYLIASLRLDFKKMLIYAERKHFRKLSPAHEGTLEKPAEIPEHEIQRLLMALGLLEPIGAFVIALQYATGASLRKISRLLKKQKWARHLKRSSLHRHKRKAVLILKAWLEIDRDKRGSRRHI